MLVCTFLSASYTETPVVVYAIHSSEKLTAVILLTVQWTVSENTSVLYDIPSGSFTEQKYFPEAFSLTSSARSVTV